MPRLKFRYSGIFVEVSSNLRLYYIICIISFNETLTDFSNIVLNVLALSMVLIFVTVLFLLC